ncbi:hypothetical protein EDD22DRAFT_850356 [Suillus occidentalis]|nr:hypothetical protein EDD22DRAFT_850356 [Suillus occidentalis]
MVSDEFLQFRISYPDFPTLSGSPLGSSTRVTLPLGVQLNFIECPLDFIPKCGAHTRCYAALVQLLKDVVEQLYNVTLLRAYPSPHEIHDQGIETINMLLQQHDDPGLPSLQTHMLQLCNLALADYKAMADNGGQWRSNFKKLQEANEWLQHVEDHAHPSLLPYNHQLSGIGYDDNALASWLQKYGPEVLSDSLFVTTIVLFGLVDSHDLTGLLEVVLEEVKTQTPLQQEENCSAFLQRGGRSFMEQRMYRAQIEVSLFSKAIANLCEELNTRSQPVSWHFAPNLRLLAMNTIGNVGTCPPPRSLNFKFFRPTKAMEKAAYDKCHAWLRASSHSQDATQVAPNSSTSPDSPRLLESFLRHDDQLSSLPCLMKSWVDNTTYNAYISASVAETNEPLRVDNQQRFIRKECKSPDALMSIFHILDLKTQWARAEADLFSEAIERTAEIEFTDDGVSLGLGTTATHDSRSPDDWFDDWFSSSSAPSNDSDSDML